MRNSRYDLLSKAERLQVQLRVHFIPGSTGVAYEKTDRAYAMAKSQGSAPKVNTAPESSQQSILDVVVTGDVFFERYLWNTSNINSTTTPYVWPEELRAARSSSSVRELGGAVLQKKIIEAYLKVPLRGMTVPPLKLNVQNFPTEDQYKAICDTCSEPPIAVMLHELTPFPLNSRKDDIESAWRIKRCFGMLSYANRKELAEATHKIDDLSKSSIKNLVSGIVQSVNPTILVINDRDISDNVKRDHSARSHLDSTRDEWAPLTEAIAKDPSVRERLLIVWHTRYPITNGNAFYDFIKSADLQSNTLVIINHMCLRESGIEIRFDQSYESSIRNMLESLSDNDVKALLHFPQILIRFDYGVLHLSANRGQLVGLDIHGLLNGPYRFETDTYGAVTGTTPIFIATIIREASEFLKEGKTLQEFLTACGKVVDPTILHSSPLDRAIDCGLLLAAARFAYGFGKYEKDGINREPDLAQGGSEEIFENIFTRFKDSVKFDKKTTSIQIVQDTTSRGNGSGEPKSDVLDIYELLLNKQDFRDELVRIGAPERLRDAGSPIDKIDTYLRTRMLSMNKIWEASQVRGDVRGDTPEQKDRRRDPTREFLRAIVKYGMQAAVARAYTDDEVFKFVEPSVLCPYVEFGSYSAVDAHEVDRFLSLRYQIANYCSQEKHIRPLNIAVFGAPGAGKSTAVKNCVRGIDEVHFDDSLVCNLSQVLEPSELNTHFHRIQDVVSSGKVPVAFFDEFDVDYNREPCGWLRFFLMAMQDGEYTVGSEAFDLSRAIFVFAGGVFHSFEKFSAFCDSKVQPKAPDFKSRLRGYLDISSIDLPEQALIDGYTNYGILATKVRRAVFMRSMLSSILPHIIDASSQVAGVSDRIIDAFLEVKSFKNGVRSMESIIAMSRVPPSQKRFEIACLPSREQIAIHVNSEEFFQFVRPRKEN